MNARVPERLSGRLLIATPVIDDDTFLRAVILVVNHTDDGSLGVVLNRPTADPVADTLPRWQDLASHPSVVFEGGPVDPTTGLALGLVKDLDAFAGGSNQPADAEIAARVPGMSGLVTVNLDGDPAFAAAYIEHMRMFSGYAGWSGGQLAGEIIAGAWFVVDGALDDVFTEQPDDLWPNILKRQPGATRWFANYPRDPAVN